MRRRLRITHHTSRSGFTLAEMLVAMAVASTVMALVFKLMAGSMEVLRDLRARTALQSQTAEFLDRLADDFHTARNHDRGF